MMSERVTTVFSDQVVLLSVEIEDLREKLKQAYRDLNDLKEENLALRRMMLSMSGARAEVSGAV